MYVHMTFISTYMYMPVCSKCTRVLAGAARAERAGETENARRCRGGPRSVALLCSPGARYVPLCRYTARYSVVHSYIGSNISGLAGTTGFTRTLRVFRSAVSCLYDSSMQRWQGRG